MKVNPYPNESQKLNFGTRLKQHYQLDPIQQQASHFNKEPSQRIAR